MYIHWPMIVMFICSKGQLHKLFLKKHVNNVYDMKYGKWLN